MARKPGLGAVGLVVAVMGAAGAAGAEDLTCSMDLKAAQGGWVAPEIAVLRDTEGGIQVLDAIIAEFHGGPISARIATENAARSTFVWRVKATDGEGGVAYVSYRLTVQTADQTARLSVQPEGYEDFFDASGQCQPF